MSLLTKYKNIYKRNGYRKCDIRLPPEFTGISGPDQIGMAGKNIAIYVGQLSVLMCLGRFICVR